MRTVMLVLFIVCAASIACREATSPGSSGDGGEPGSMTPPNDYMGTGRGGLGMPSNDVGTDASYLPDVGAPEKR